MSADEVSKGEDVEDEKRGPSTKPWGMPWDSGVMEEVQLLMLMNCCLLVRYDLNQESAVPVML